MALRSVAWLAVPLAGLLELGGHFYFSERAPDVDGWHDARDLLSRLRKDDELVVIAPRWAEPNARHAFGDVLMPLEHVARADESAFRRAIEVSILGERAPELGDWAIIAEHEHGKFTFRVLENPAPESVVYDFTDHIARASVFDRARGREEPCRWNPRARRSAGGLHGHPAFPRERHECRGPDWHFVGVTVVADDRWLPRRCVWAHPAGGKELVIRYEGITFGAVIRGYATLPWWLEREKKGTPVFMQIAIDGEPVGKYVHRDGDGWKPFTFATERAGSRGTVEFRISSARAKSRQFCFVADTR